MPDEPNTPSEGQELEDEQTPQAGAEVQPGAEPEEQPLDPKEAARLRAEIRKVRKEAADSRVKLKQHEDAQLSEQQKLERERNEATAAREEAESRARDLQVRVLALDLGVRKEAAGDVARLLDWDEIDASDEKAVGKAIRELLKEKSYLSGRPDGLDGGADRNGHEKQASGLTQMLLDRSRR